MKYLLLIFFGVAIWADKGKEIIALVVREPYIIIVVVAGFFIYSMIRTDAKIKFH